MHAIHDLCERMETFLNFHQLSYMKTSVRYQLLVTEKMCSKLIFFLSKIIPRTRKEVEQGTVIPPMIQSSKTKASK